MDDEVEVRRMLPGRKISGRLGPRKDGGRCRPRLPANGDLGDISGDFPGGVSFTELRMKASASA